MKIGIEVEGRLKGIATLFMTAMEAIEFFSYKSLVERSDRPIKDMLDRVKHVYISDHNNALNPHLECFNEWAKMGMPVTIECTEVGNDRQRFPSNVGLMLAIVDEQLSQNASFWNLAPTDQVKFSSPKGPAHVVYVVTKENMAITQPHDFQGDFEFTARRDAEFMKGM